MLTLVVLVLGLWALTWYATLLLRQDMERMLGEQQYQTVSAMAEDINNALTERIAGGRAAAQLISQPLMQNPRALQTWLDQRVVLPLFNGGAFVTDRNGVVLADAPHINGRIGHSYATEDDVAAVLRDGQAVISQPVIGRVSRLPLFCIVVPVFGANDQVMGALVGVIELGRPSFLDRIAQFRYGQTGGYMLMSPEQGLIISATDPSRIMQPLPASGRNAMHDRYMRGFEGYGVAVSSRGVEEISAARRIPVAGWVLVAVMPTAEAFAPVRAVQRNMLAAAVCLTLLAGVLVWWILKRQLSPLLETTQALRRLASGHTTEVLPATRPDEMGQLIEGFNQVLRHHQAHEDSLRASEALQQGVLNALDAALVVVNAQRVVVAVNQRWQQWLSQGSELEGRIGWTLTTGQIYQLPCGRSDDVGSVNLRVLDGLQAVLSGRLPSFRVEFLCEWFAEPRWFSVAIWPMPQGSERWAVVAHTDISENVRDKAQIDHLSFYDPLTHLPNRRLLRDRLDQALRTSTRHQRNNAVLFIDLDHFKTINDTMGHAMGDVLLIQVAQKLRCCLQEGDTVARLGSDEFVVMLEDLSKDRHEAAAQAENVARRIMRSFDSDIVVESARFHTTLSVGLVLFDGRSADAGEEPLKQAELAMFQAKAAGRNTLRFFESRMQAEVLERSQWANDLRTALAEQQFLLYFQPQVFSSGRISGAEVLLRWQHPQRGMVFPAQFVPMAEAFGLILPMGQWVLEAACTQLAQWARHPVLATLTMSVNVSADQFRQLDFVNSLQALLMRTGANPKRLKLELTESMLVDDVEDTIVKMQTLKALGVAFSLDDFGTGYSSLAYLKRLPLQQLKIDQGFVRNIVTDANDAAIARMVVGLAQSMGLSVIAEGVETQAQADTLAHLGCHSFQGYLFGRPMPQSEFEALLRGR